MGPGTWDQDRGRDRGQDRGWDWGRDQEQDWGLESECNNTIARVNASESANANAKASVMSKSSWNANLRTIRCDNECENGGGGEGRQSCIPFALQLYSASAMASIIHMISAELSASAAGNLRFDQCCLPVSIVMAVAFVFVRICPSCFVHCDSLSPYKFDSLPLSCSHGSLTRKNRSFSQKAAAASLTRKNFSF